MPYEYLKDASIFQSIRCVFDIVSGKEGLEPGAFGTCCSQPSQDCLILISPDVGPKAKFEKLFCKPFWCPWPVACLLRSKRHCCLDEQRVCFRPETSESKSLIFIEHYLVIFPVIPDNSMYCVWCFFFWNEVCPVFKPNNYFWGLARISGIWMEAVSCFTVF